MKTKNEPPDGPSPPHWMDTEVLRKFSASAQIVQRNNCAVELIAGDPRIPISFLHLKLEPQRLLHPQGRFVFDQVRSEFDFGRLDFWGEQYQWLKDLFHVFYPESEQAIGTFQHFEEVTVEI